MFKRLLFVASILLVAGAPSLLADVGVFDLTDDIGTGGYGVTTTAGDSGVYEIIGNGADIWGTADSFHFAYNVVSGDVRFELSPAWESAHNYWAKIETMLRVDTSQGSRFIGTATRKGDVDTTPTGVQPVHNWVGTQKRDATNGGASGGTEWSGSTPSKIGIQKVTVSGWQFVETLVDYGTGSGWEVLNQYLNPGLPDTLLVGAAVTSHESGGLARAVISDVAYTANPELIGGIPGVKISDPIEPCGDIPGFMVKVVQMPEGQAFGDDRAINYQIAEWLTVNENMGPDFPATVVGTRHDEFVNLYDSGGYNAYDDDTERSFPGIDATIINPSQPADGDDDDQFGVLVTGCIELTEGIHVIGGAFDDGLKISIGGVEIGRTNSWDEVGQWMFDVETAGHYDFEAVGYEIGGGAYLEIYEFFSDGSMALLNDVANGASAVYVPEPATIALLGFGGLSMLRIRKKR